MTCERRYDIAVVKLLQQAAANIEAERRRQYRAEMSQELRAWLRGDFAEWIKMEGAHKGRGATCGLP